MHPESIRVSLFPKCCAAAAAANFIGQMKNLYKRSVFTVLTREVLLHMKFKLPPYRMYLWMTFMEMPFRGTPEAGEQNVA